MSPLFSLRRFSISRLLIFIIITLAGCSIFMFQNHSRTDEGLNQVLIDNEMKGYRWRKIRILPAVASGFDDSLLPILFNDNSYVTLDNNTIGNYEEVPEKKPLMPSLPGEMGHPVSTGQNESFSRLIQEYGFNIVASDMISMNRRLPDTRPVSSINQKHAACLSVFTRKPYLSFPEAWSTLLRTVHSIVNRSPAILLHEILLVDDKSDKEHLINGKLETYLKTTFGLIQSVKVKKLPERVGLIAARTIGAKMATGEVLVFLDAHCEVNVNWLVPLLAPIAADRNIVTVPIIEQIHQTSFEYLRSYYRTDPEGLYRSPTHAGGLLAMDRQWLQMLEYYDPQLKIWGGEQFELSFKNLGRVAEVWMDEYKTYYYRKMPQNQHLPLGDISDQTSLRSKLNCRSFKWYMTQVAYDLQSKYPLPPDIQEWGSCSITTPENHALCLDTMMQPMLPSKLSVVQCHNMGGNQMFILNEKGQLSQGELCIEWGRVSNSTQNSDLIRVPCKDDGGNWSYEKDMGQLQYNFGNHSNSMCLSATFKDNESMLGMERCSLNLNPNQRWIWQEFYKIT